MTALYIDQAHATQFITAFHDATNFLAGILFVKPIYSIHASRDVNNNSWV